MALVQMETWPRALRGTSERWHAQEQKLGEQWKFADSRYVELLDAIRGKLDDADRQLVSELDEVVGIRLGEAQDLGAISGLTVTDEAALS